MNCGTAKLCCEITYLVRPTHRKDVKFLLFKENNFSWRIFFLPKLFFLCYPENFNWLFQINITINNMMKTMYGGGEISSKQDSIDVEYQETFMLEPYWGEKEKPMIFN